MEKWTGSKLEKQYIKAVYCHPAYLTSVQRTSCKILGWINHKLESSCQEKYLLLLYWLCESFWLCGSQQTGKFWKRWEYQTCLLRNLYAGHEATVRTMRGTIDWLHIGKGVRQGCIVSPCLFNLYAEYITGNARLDEAQAGSRLLGEISITSDVQMTPSLWQKVKS